MFLITHLLRFSVRHPRLVITLAGAITVCAVLFIPRIQLRLDGRSLIPSNLPEFAEGDLAASRFELRDLVLIGVGNEDQGIYTPETLRRIARLSDGLARIDGVVPDSVISLSTVPRVTLVNGNVDTSPLYRPEDQLTPDDIHAGTTALELMVDATREGWFNSVEGLSALGSLEWVLARVPHVGAVNCLFNDVVRTNGSLIGLNYSAYRTALRTGRLPLTNDDIDRAFTALSRSTQSPLSARVDAEHRSTRVTVFIRDADYTRIDNVLRAAEREISTHGLGHKIVPFGDGWISYLTVRLLVEGQASSIALALVTDLILITLLLGSVRMGLIAVLPVAFSLLLVLAALALAGTPLGIANSMFAGIALGIGLDFASHLATAYQQRLKQGMPASEALRTTLELTGPAICVSAASITAGFSVLMLSEIAPNVQLGVMICLSFDVRRHDVAADPESAQTLEGRQRARAFTSTCPRAETAAIRGVAGQ